MKRALSYIMTILIVLSVLPFCVVAEPIDMQKLSSLTLQYRYGEESFSDLTICTYRVAQVTAKGEYALTGEFKDYPVSLQGITSQAQWRIICSTLSAYISANGARPTETQITDDNGTAVFSDILPGLYLTLSVRVEKADKITVFESFMTAVPYPDANGDYLYDVEAHPKCEQREPDLKELEYKVVKQWKDNSLLPLRPEKISVDILKDGTLHTSVTLSPENNWSYSWKAPDDGSKWQAVERGVPEYYTVTVEEFGTTIVITNVYDDNEKPPQTGDTILPHMYVLIASFVGIGMMLLAVWRKRSGV